MRRIKLIALLAALAVLCSLPAHAWLWGEDKPLVSIDKEHFNANDFKDWWQSWQEDGQPLPETLDPFIEWQLLAKEAKRMELFQERSYRHKINTFLKVRSLMLFKEEEVDSKIVVDETSLRKHYETFYAPRHLVQMFFYADAKQADEAHQQILNEPTAVTTLKNLAPEKGGPSHFQEKWLRPTTIPEAWQQTMANLKQGEISLPFSWRGGTLFIRSLESKNGDDQDFDALKQQLRSAMQDRQHKRLTAELIQRLYKKYDVQIDEALLSAIPVDAQPLPEELAEKPLITTTKRNISARDFRETIKKEQSFRKNYGFKKEQADAIKQRILRGILSQTLTSWEAQARHYEQKPPLAAIFKFYQQHRLIKELEKRLFTPKATTSTEEITAYYQQHQEEFSQPEIITMLTAHGDEAMAQKVWTGIITGEDFSALVKKYYGHEPAPQQVPLNHLDPELVKALQPLAKDEVSPPFAHQNGTTMVKLLGRKPAGSLPLSKVGDKIGKKLVSEKLSRLRDEYLAKLKAKSSISVDNRAWQALKKELGEK